MCAALSDQGTVYPPCSAHAEEQEKTVRHEHEGKEECQDRKADGQEEDEGEFQGEGNHHRGQQGGLIVVSGHVGGPECVREDVEGLCKGSGPGSTGLPEEADGELEFPAVRPCSHGVHGIIEGGVLPPRSVPYLF